MALLLASELVSNAVLHGAPPIGLSIQLSPGGDSVRVEVHDGSPQLPPARAPEISQVREHGRGLQIVDTLAAAWGSRPGEASGGKTSWFRLDAT